jgi:hypothetical protein
VAEANPRPRKLQYKGQPALLDGVPDELHAALSSIERAAPRASQHDFALVFVRSMAEAEGVAETITSRLSPAAVFWLAYPQQTSRKYRADINRDKGNALFQSQGLTGVAMVSLDDDWSAMRFRRHKD